MGDEGRQDIGHRRDRLSFAKHQRGAWSAAYNTILVYFRQICALGCGAEERT